MFNPYRVNKSSIVNQLKNGREEDERTACNNVTIAWRTTVWAVADAVPRGSQSEKNGPLCITNNHIICLLANDGDKAVIHLLLRISIERDLGLKAKRILIFRE